MKIKKDNQKYEINFEEYQKIYKEETAWSMSLSANPLNFGNKNEYNAGKGYLAKALFFAYKSELLAIKEADGADKARAELNELVDAYYAEYKEDRAFLTEKSKQN